MSVVFAIPTTAGGVAFDIPSNFAISGPVLSSPTGTATGSSTYTGTVDTDVDTGTLYHIATENSSELIATIKAGSSQAVTVIGTQNVSGSGLSAETTYYNHYVHNDGSNDSNVVSSPSYLTDVAPADSFYSNEGMIAFFRQETGLDSYNFNELAIAYYNQSGATNAPQFNHANSASQEATGYVGLAPTDWRNSV